MSVILILIEAPDITVRKLKANGVFFESVVKVFGSIDTTLGFIGTKAYANAALVIVCCAP
jgi:hypothetical protein